MKRETLMVRCSTLAACIALTFIIGCARQDAQQSDELASLTVVSGSQLQSFVSESELPVLVEFGVDYRCDRCREMKRSVVGLGEKFEGRAEFVRVDFNANAALVSQLGGTICPTYVFFEDGQPVKTVSFPVSADILESHLTAMLR
jgi:thioredoxin-like negative regulator of GroEL